MPQMAGWRWGSPARKVSGSRAKTSAAEAFNSPLTTESIDGSVHRSSLSQGQFNKTYLTLMKLSFSIQRVKVTLQLPSGNRRVLRKEKKVHMCEQGPGKGRTDSSYHLNASS